MKSTIFNIVIGVALGGLLAFLLIRGYNKPTESQASEKVIEMGDIVKQLKEANEKLFVGVLNEMAAMNAATQEELIYLGQAQADNIEKVIHYNRQIRTEIKELTNQRQAYEKEVQELHELAKVLPDGNQ